MYKTPVHSKLEYAAPVWDPGQVTLINALGAAQNAAARFTLGNYHRIASVSSTKNPLSMSPLVHQHKIFRLRLFHKTYFVNSILNQRLVITTPYVSSRVDHSHKVGISFCHANVRFMSFMQS